MTESDYGVTSWKPQPKIVATGIVALVLWGLNALGVDIGTVLDSAGDAVGIDVPDADVITTSVIALLAGYIKTN